MSLFSFIDIIALFFSRDMSPIHTVCTIIVYSRLSRSYLPHFLLADFGLCFAGLFVEIIFQPMPFSLPLSCSLSTSFILPTVLFYNNFCCCCCCCCWNIFLLSVFVYAFSIRSGMFMRIFCTTFTNIEVVWTEFDRIGTFRRWYTCYGLSLCHCVCAIVTYTMYTIQFIEQRLQQNEN